MFEKTLFNIEAYFDYNAGAPLHPRVRQELLSFLQSDLGFSAAEGGPFLAIPNASSSHTLGREGKRWLSEARERVAHSLGAKPDSITFTSSGTEANQMVVRSFVENCPGLGRKTKGRWITSAVDHSCHLKFLPWVKSQGIEVVVLPVDASGQITREVIGSHILSVQASDPLPCLLSIGWVNNETGVVQPLDEWLGRLKAVGVQVHLDGAQAWGKIPVDISKWNVDYVGVAGAKIGALPGSGALWSRDPQRLAPIFHGSQERSLRGGTENILGIRALGVAAAAIDPLGFASKVQPLRDQLEKALVEMGCVVNGGSALRIPNTCNAVLPYLTSDVAIGRLDLEGFRISSGSACSAGAQTPSTVLLAMGRSEEEAKRALRISMGWGTTPEATRALVEALSSLLGK